MTIPLQKTCLVTGANSGIGKEIALGLAKCGEFVIMVCRHAKRGQAALEEIKKLSGSDSVELLMSDLSSQEEIRALANIVNQRYGTLDILINNAGLVNTKKTLSKDGIEMTLATNHLAPFLLTDLLLNLLKRSSPSRIINISSAIHKWAKVDIDDLQYDTRKYKILKAYAQSKCLMNSYTFELARQLEGTGVTVNCVHPGAVKTSLGSNNATTAGMKIIEKIIKCFFISPEDSARSILELALAPKFETITGEYFVKGKPAKSSSITHDHAFAKNIWEKSNDLVSEE